jgi:hypothetical protein
MRNSRMPARSRKASEVKPAATEAAPATTGGALPPAHADAAGNDGINSDGQRRSGRRTKSGAQAKPDTAGDAMARLEPPQVQEETGAAGDAQQSTPAKKRSSRSARARKPKADAAAE